MAGAETLGFIGLGVMGEPICRNLRRRSGRRILAHDLRPEPLQRLAADGVEPAAGPAALAAAADVIFLSLPGGPEVEAVVEGADGLRAAGRPGQTIVDLSTSPVASTRRLATGLAKAGIAFADAPVARTRAAAEAGTLSVMVGADAALFRRLQPLLACFASEVSHCGGVGAGQVVKLMNNMVLLQTVVALAEALSVGRRAGVDGEVLFATLAKGSADSFALRNHGMKALLPGAFPEQAFAAEYMLKDLDYALQLAREAGLDLAGAGTARRLLEATIAAGHGARYWPALLHVVERPADA